MVRENRSARISVVVILAVIVGGSGIESLFSYSEMALSPNNLGYSVGAGLEWDGCNRGTCYPLGLGSGSCLAACLRNNVLNE